MNAIMSITQPHPGMNWNVIDMAREDGPRSLKPDGFLARLGRGLFGASIPRKLANDSLEALRRFSVRAWFWDFVPAGELRAFMEAGYTRTDARRILSYIAHHRGFTPSLLEGAA